MKRISFDLQKISRKTRLFSRKSIIFILMVAMIFSNISTGIAFAVEDNSEEDVSEGMTLYEYYAQNGVRFYSANTVGDSCDTLGGTSSESSSGGNYDDPSTPTGKNAQTVADYFADKGFSGAGIAGIIGNMLIENPSFNTARGENSNIASDINLASGKDVEKMTTYESNGSEIGYGKPNGYKDGTADYSGSSFGKPGRVPGGGGLIQITSAYKYADIPSNDWLDIKKQLDYYWSEFDTAFTVNGIKNNVDIKNGVAKSDSAGDAARNFAIQFVNGNYQHLSVDDRTGRANEVYKNSDFKLSNGKTLKEVSADNAKLDANFGKSDGESISSGSSGGCSSSGKTGQINQNSKAGEVIAWIMDKSNWNGKTNDSLPGIDWDNAYGAQCYDIGGVFIEKTTGVNVRGGGDDIPRGHTKALEDAGWTIILNPKLEDLGIGGVVFETDGSGPHTEIIVSITNNEIEFLTQNRPSPGVIPVKINETGAGKVMGTSGMPITSIAIPPENILK